MGCGNSKAEEVLPTVFRDSEENIQPEVQPDPPPSGESASATSQSQQHSEPTHGDEVVATLQAKLDALISPDAGVRKRKNARGRVDAVWSELKTRESDKKALESLLYPPDTAPVVIHDDSDAPLSSPPSLLNAWRSQQQYGPVAAGNSGSTEGPLSSQTPRPSAASTASAFSSSSSDGDRGRRDTLQLAGGVVGSAPLLFISTGVAASSDRMTTLFTNDTGLEVMRQQGSNGDLGALSTTPSLIIAEPSIPGASKSSSSPVLDDGDDHVDGDGLSPRPQAVSSLTTASTAADGTRQQRLLSAATAGAANRARVAYHADSWTASMTGTNTTSDQALSLHRGIVVPALTMASSGLDQKSTAAVAATGQLYSSTPIHALVTGTAAAAPANNPSSGSHTGPNFNLNPSSSPGPNFNLKSGEPRVNRRLGVIIGSAESVGPRADQEDRHFVSAAAAGDDRFVFASVMDGHGGDAVAEYLRTHLCAAVLDAVAAELKYSSRYHEAVARVAAAAGAAQVTGQFTSRSAASATNSGNDAIAGPNAADDTTTAASAGGAHNSSSNGTATANGATPAAAAAVIAAANARLPRTQSALRSVAESLAAFARAEAAAAGHAGEVVTAPPSGAAVGAVSNSSKRLSKRLSGRSGMAVGAGDAQQLQHVVADAQPQNGVTATLTSKTLREGEIKPTGAPAAVGRLSPPRRSSALELRTAAKHATAPSTSTSQAPSTSTSSVPPAPLAVTASTVLKRSRDGPPPLFPRSSSLPHDPSDDDEGEIQLASTGRGDQLATTRRELQRGGVARRASATAAFSRHADADHPPPTATNISALAGNADDRPLSSADPKLKFSADDRPLLQVPPPPHAAPSRFHHSSSARIDDERLLGSVSSSTSPASPLRTTSTSSTRDMAAAHARRSTSTSMGSQQLRLMGDDDRHTNTSSTISSPEQLQLQLLPVGAALLVPPLTSTFIAPPHHRPSGSLFAPSQPKQVQQTRPGIASETAAAAAGGGGANQVQQHTTHSSQQQPQSQLHPGGSGGASGSQLQLVPPTLQRAHPPLRPAASQPFADPGPSALTPSPTSTCAHPFPSPPTGGGAPSTSTCAHPQGRVLETSYAPGEPDFRRILTYVFQAIDEIMLGAAAHGRIPQTAGSCAVCVLLWGDALIIANTGDCEAWLCRGGQPYELTCPHKADRDSEASRIRHSGGVVTHWRGQARVAGALQVSRSIGMYALKHPQYTGVVPHPFVRVSQLLLPPGTVIPPPPQVEVGRGGPATANPLQQQQQQTVPILEAAPPASTSSSSSSSSSSSNTTGANSSTTLTSMADVQRASTSASAAAGGATADACVTSTSSVDAQRASNSPADAQRTSTSLLPASSALSAHNRLLDRVRLGVEPAAATGSRTGDSSSGRNAPPHPQTTSTYTTAEGQQHRTASTSTGKGALSSSGGNTSLHSMKQQQQQQREQLQPVRMARTGSGVWDGDLASLTVPASLLARYANNSECDMPSVGRSSAQASGHHTLMLSRLSSGGGGGGEESYSPRAQPSPIAEIEVEFAAPSPIAEVEIESAAPSPIAEVEVTGGGSSSARSSHSPTTSPLPLPGLSSNSSTVSPPAGRAPTSTSPAPLRGVATRVSAALTSSSTPNSSEIQLQPPAGGTRGARPLQRHSQLGGGSTTASTGTKFSSSGDRSSSSSAPGTNTNQRVSVASVFSRGIGGAAAAGTSSNQRVSVASVFSRGVAGAAAGTNSGGSGEGGETPPMCSNSSSGASSATAHAAGEVAAPVGSASHDVTATHSASAADATPELTSARERSTSGSTPLMQRSSAADAATTPRHRPVAATGDTGTQGASTSTSVIAAAAPSLPSSTSTSSPPAAAAPSSSTTGATPSTTAPPVTDEFIVLGSDGLFDVFPNKQEMMIRIKKALRATGSADGACAEVVREAVTNRRSSDNVTMVLLLLNQYGVVTSTAGAGGGVVGYARRAAARKLHSRAKRDLKRDENLARLARTYSSRGPAQMDPLQGRYQLQLGTQQSPQVNPLQGHGQYQLQNAPSRGALLLDDGAAAAEEASVAVLEGRTSTSSIDAAVVSEGAPIHLVRDEEGDEADDTVSY